MQYVRIDSLSNSYSKQIYISAAAARSTRGVLVFSTGPFDRVGWGWLVSMLTSVDIYNVYHNVKSATKILLIILVDVWKALSSLWSSWSMLNLFCHQCRRLTFPQTINMLKLYVPTWVALRVGISSFDLLGSVTTNTLKYPNISLKIPCPGWTSLKQWSLDRQPFCLGIIWPPIPPLDEKDISFTCNLNVMW